MLGQNPAVRCPAVLLARFITYPSDIAFTRPSRLAATQPMILSRQLGAMRPDRGDQFSRRDLIAHLTLNPGFARVDIDQQ